MKYIKCPDEFTGHQFKIFCAGGISNCSDWQDTAQKYLAPHLNDDYAFINPRRYDFDLSDPSASSWQIEWEYNYLMKSDMIMFWFPHETLCPITLFELGVYCKYKHIIVGVDDNYARRFDVIKQMSLYKPGIKVKTSLQETLDTTIQFAKALNK